MPYGLSGRATADGTINLPEGDGIEAVLIRDALTHATRPISIVPAQIFVAKSSNIQAHS